MSLSIDGVWKAGVWATTVWADGVWREGDAPVVDDDPVQTPAGASKRNRPNKRRFYVEIDGNQFPVDSAAEAEQLLLQARALAEAKAEQSAATAETNVKRIAKRTGTVPALEIRKPEITVSPEISAETSALRADIDRLYERAAMLAELRVLLAEKLAKEDEEEAELMLLL